MGAEATLAIGKAAGRRASWMSLRAAAATASLGGLICRAETAAIVAAGALDQRAWARPHTEQED